MKKYAEMMDLISASGLKEIHDLIRHRHSSATNSYIKDLQVALKKSERLDFSLFFDEAFYLANNRDVFEHVYAGEISSGLHHFLGWGIFEKRSPLRGAELSKIVKNFEMAMPGGSEGYSKQGPVFEDICGILSFLPIDAIARVYLGGDNRFNDVSLKTSDILNIYFPLVGAVRLMYDTFDEEYYSQNLNQKFPGKFSAFVHYLNNVKNSRLSPNKDFDEDFYRAFYYDVNTAILRGQLSSGYEHFLLSGKAEGRIPLYDATRTLEAVMAGVTDPVGLQTFEQLERKVLPCPHRVVDNSPPTVWFIVPFLHSDLMFGGFSSLLEFIEGLIRRSIRIGLFIKDAPAGTLDYFRYRSPLRLLSMNLSNIRIFSPVDGETEFQFGSRDIFFCYSNWDGLWGLHFAANTTFKKPIFWIQEHEAIFFSNDSKKFLVDSVYLEDHVGVFNSEFLRKYFHRQKIGKYREASFLRKNSISYEHVFQMLDGGDFSVQEPIRKKRFLIYSRPEAHAARNLFEIGVISLRILAREGVFDDDWEIVGVGALGGPYTVELHAGVDLKIVPKMSLQEYTTFIQGVDVGMSLMYAPHPSLLPYELALAGALVVTNNFEERDESYFESFGENIISFDMSVGNCVEAIRNAVNKVNSPGYKKSFPSREKRTWDDVFSEEFYRGLSRMGVTFDEFSL